MDPIVPPENNPDPIERIACGCAAIGCVACVIVLTLLWIHWS